MFFSWRKWLKGKTRPIRKSAKVARSPASVRPHLEALEDRITPATIVVDTTADTVGVDGHVSLREAIQSIDAGRNINADVGAVAYGTSDQIQFNIGDGLQRIDVAPGNGALPAITNPVTLDGDTSLAHPTQRIQIDGGALPSTTTVDGLSATGANVVVKNVNIEHFTGNGVSFSGANDAVYSYIIGGNKGNGVYLKGDNEAVQGCFIGTDGLADNLGDVGFGVVIDGASGDDIGWSSQNYVASADYNHISWNQNGGIEITGAGAKNNVVGDNDIGASNTIATDTTGNGNMGVYVTNGASSNLIGLGANGPQGASNVICGNVGGGVVIDQGSNGNQVGGNYIGIRWGTDPQYGDVVPNGGYGVEVRWTGDYASTQNNVIGGGSSQERNIISGNAKGGVLITGGTIVNGNPVGAINNQVLSNYIGTDLDGDDALDGQGFPTGNYGDGVMIEDGSKNQIGGPGDLNLISGNFGNGVHIYYLGSSPTNNRVWENNIGTDAAGNDASYLLLNTKNGVYLEGMDKQHMIGFTGIQNTNIVFAKGQSSIATKDAAAPFINGTKTKQHVLNNAPAAPGVLIVDSTDVQIGQQAGDTNYFDGGVEQDDSTVAVAGTLTVNGDYAENGGTLTLQSGTVVADNVNVASGAVLTGYGTITADVTNAGEVDAENYDPLTVTGAFTQTGGVTNVGTGYWQSGRLNVSGAFTEQGGTVNLSYGILEADGGMRVESGAALSGYGTVTGDLTNAGSITVSGDMNATLSVTGDYTQTSTGALTLDLVYGMEQTMLNVSGHASLDGAFTLDSLDGQTPSVGSSLWLIGYSSESGSFASMQLPSLGDGTWEALYTSYGFELYVQSS